MRIATPLRAATMTTAAAFVAACATVLGFPDRSLDDEAGADGATPPPGAALDAADRAARDAGPQRAMFSADAVDFGLLPCGADAGASHTVTIQNVGGAPLLFLASLSTSTEFALAGPTSGTIAPGASADVVVTSKPVPALAGAGETAQAVLVVATNDPAAQETTLGVVRTAGGATITVVPLTAAFGDTPPTVPAGDVPLAVRNVGNQPVAIAFGAPTDPQFSLTCDDAACGAPPGASVAPDASATRVVARFTPNDAGDFLATSTIRFAGATCGTSPTVITLSGKGSGSYASVQPGSLDFGLVDCGTAAPAKTFTIINSSPLASFHWTLAASPAHYTLTTPAGAVPAGTPQLLAAKSSVVVRVTPAAIAQSSSVAPDLYGETLSITTDATGDTDPHLVKLLMTAHGAILAQSAATIPFGAVLVSGPPATFPFTVSNTGNAKAQISFVVGDPAFAVGPMNQVVAGGGSYAAAASFHPAAAALYASSAQMSVAAGTVLCAPVPGPIALSGQGALSASLTSSVDFGLVDCGSAAAAKTAALTNTGSATFTWGAALANGTASYTISPSSGTLSVGASATITITPKAIPGSSATTPDLYGDTLRVTTNPPLESPYVASIHETAQGAILSFSPASLDFGQVAAGGTGSQDFTVVNDGNVAADVTLVAATAPPRASPNVFHVTSSPLTVPALASIGDSATYTPPGSAPSGRVYDGTIAATTGAVLCQPLPVPLVLSGTVR